MESVLQRREEESPGRFSNRWRTQEHKDNSPQGDHSSTKLGAVLGAVEAGTEGPPGQLPEEYRGLDKDKPASDTSTKYSQRKKARRYLCLETTPPLLEIVSFYSVSVQGLLLEIFNSTFQHREH